MRRVNVSEPEVICKNYEFELRTILSVRVWKLLFIHLLFVYRVKANCNLICPQNAKMYPLYRGAFTLFYTPADLRVGSDNMAAGRSSLLIRLIK